MERNCRYMEEIKLITSIIRNASINDYMQAKSSLHALEELVHENNYLFNQLSEFKLLANKQSKIIEELSRGKE